MTRARRRESGIQARRRGSESAAVMRPRKRVQLSDRMGWRMWTMVSMKDEDEDEDSCMAAGGGVVLFCRLCVADTGGRVYKPCIGRA